MLDITLIAVLLACVVQLVPLPAEWIRLIDPQAIRRQNQLCGCPRC